MVQIESAIYEPKTHEFVMCPTMLLTDVRPKRRLGPKGTVSLNIAPRETQNNFLQIFDRDVTMRLFSGSILLVRHSFASETYDPADRRLAMSRMSNLNRRAAAIGKQYNSNNTMIFSHADL
jgi:hypothetical protein